MMSNLEFYSAMASYTATHLTDSWQRWTAFFTTASRLYKYPFHEQLMIFAQRPDATACAEYDLWNDTMRRYVRRGSKGIALVDNSREKPRLRYVFDISDTGLRKNSRHPFLWELRPEHEAAVAQALAERFGAPPENNLAEQLESIAAQLVSEYWVEHKRDILDIVDGSFLEGYDEFNIGVQFRNAATVSITYSLLSRCGLEPEGYFDHEDFLSIFDFNTPEAVAALGTAVSQSNQQVLRQIGITIQNYERAKFAERSVTHGEQPDLHQERRLSDPRPEAGGNEAPGPVREDAPGLSEGASAGPVQRHDGERETVPAPERDRADHEPAAGADDAGADAGGGRDGGTESPRSDDLGGVDEQLQSPGGGNPSDGTYIQLTLFPSEQEQIRRIDEGPGVFASGPSAVPEPEPAPPAPATPRRALTQADIDAAIQEWNGNIESKHAVVRYMKDHAREKDTAAWLRQEYGDALPAFPVTTDGAAGDVPWPKVQRRIAQLIKEDRFYTEAEQDRFDNIDPIAIREALAERGIVNGQVAEPEKLDNDPFIQQVMRDVEAIATEEHAEPVPEPPAPDLSGQPVTREGDTITIGNGEPTHEIDITVSDEEYEAIQQAIPEEKVYDPAAPVYHEGDTVYLENQEYQITELRADTVQLLPSGMAYPIFRAESRERFEQLLKNDLRNGPITEYLSADPEKADQDLREVLTSGLFAWQDKEYISRWLRDGEGNTKIAQRLSELYSGRVETMDLATGDIADYRTFTTSVEVEILDHEERKLATLAYRWDELTPLLRGLYVKEQDGFFQDPKQFQRYAVEAATGGLEGQFVIRDRQTGDFYAPNGFVDFWISTEEAEKVADRLNQTTLEGIPSYQVGDPVTLPAPDHPITGTIDAIEDTTVRIYTGPYAWSYDVISREQFETWLRQDERNAGLFTPDTRETPAPEITSEPVTVYPGDKNGLPYDVVVERLHIDEPEPTPPEPAPPAEQADHQENAVQPRRTGQNFRITDDHLGEGGPRLKYQANITAIRLLKELEAAGQQASPEQQEVLSRYVGWGGVPEAFDPSKTAWAKEYAELKELLTPEEYEAARASTLNAHYTSPMVIRTIYEAVEQMGFHSGNILEPSCGVGNFFGMLPESMSESKLYGVELDSITGRIARQLYPNARIEVNGFEKTQYPDGVFDLAIGNVPFGNYRVSDRPYDRHNLLIHDYFFAKTIDKVRAGGIIAFITSNGISGGTMDKKDAHAREYMARRCDLLGAVRLPNTTFRANAGTDIAMDIVFLQKREVPRMQGEPLPEWVETDLLRTNTYTDKDGRERHDHVTMNRYFRTHPEMVLGDLDIVTGPFGPQLVCNPREGADLEQQLREAMQHIQGRYIEAALPELGEGEDIDTSLPADPDVKNYSYTVVDGAVYYRENSRMVRPDLNATAEARIKGLVELRDCVQRLINLEMNAAMPDAAIREQMAELNRLYDAFSAKYGLINDRANRLAFADDSSYYLLCALEVLDEDGRLERKADMFTKRTIKPHEAVASVDTAAEALAVSISEKACVDMGYMASLTGRTGDELAEELRGVIFQVPGITEPDGSPHYVTANEYLSGNVRQKLRQAQRAAERDPAFSVNVEALTAAQPKDLDASEIEVRLGATWIDKEYIQQFMYETFKTPPYLRDVIEVKYVPYTAEWQVTGKNSVGYNNVAAYTTFGTNRANAYKILEDSLNLRDVRIYDTVEDADGKERRVLNAKETTLAAQKQQAIREAFRDWIWKDPQRRQALVRQYNEEMNSTRPREYDGSHIVFGGMNPSITLREHQKNAIAHVLYGGNTLLAHEVGAGKTFEMVAAAMEAKRLGLCQKSLFVVPNHLTEQWASEFLRLYPSANILVTTKKDFEKHNRKKFCARIATGDYDAIIIGHSQFEKIPISKERQERLLREQIWEITEGISEVESSGGERFTVKQLERIKKSLEARLEKLQAEGRKDDVVTFEQLGVDRLFVDEAHNYKNLFLYTKMRNVAGLSTTDAQKSSDMFAKCRYMDEITGSRGVIFATGTPVSNSMTELYTMQRYLQYDRLQELGMAHFDCWASRFGETVTALELAPEGTGYRARTRFSKFFNLPELMNLFKEIADIKTADQLHLPTPEVEYHNIVAQPTEHQKEMVKALSERAAKVHGGSIDPREDNMLKIVRC